MSPVRLTRLLRLDLRRSRLRLATSGVGVAMAVATLVFLFALALGLRSTLVNDLFPLDRLEGAAEGKSLGLLAFRIDLGGDTLDQETIEQLSELPGVARVYPKMKLMVPAVASGGGSLLGSGVQTDLVADGIDPELVVDDVGEAFRYEGLATTIECRSDRECGEEGYCSGRDLGGRGICRRYVPVLVSNHLVELYNGSFRRAYRLPQLDPEAVLGFTFEMSFGASTIRRSTGRPVVERMRLAGFSDQAMTLGVTLPLEFVRELNGRFGSAEASNAYHSAVLQLESSGAAPSVLAAVEDMNLLVTDRGARRAAHLMTLLLLIIGAVGAAVLVVAALSVAQSFFVTVWSRRREIGVMRAIGASRGHIRSLYLAEAVCMGAVAGVVGAASATAMAWLIDWLGRSWVPDFPYKPDSFFVFDPRLLVGAVVLAVAACAVGAAIPVFRAVSKDPADALIDT